MSEDSELFHGFSWGKEKKNIFYCVFCKPLFFFFFQTCRNRSPSSLYLPTTCRTTKKKKKNPALFLCVFIGYQGKHWHRSLLGPCHHHTLCYRYIISMTTFPMIPEVNQPTRRGRIAWNWRMVSAQDSCDNFFFFCVFLLFS